MKTMQCQRNLVKSILARGFQCHTPSYGHGHHAPRYVHVQPQYSSNCEWVVTGHGYHARKVWVCKAPVHVHVKAPEHVKVVEPKVVKVVPNVNQTLGYDPAAFAKIGLPGRQVPECKKY